MQILNSKSQHVASAVHGMETASSTRRNMLYVQEF